MVRSFRCAAFRAARCLGVFVRAATRPADAVAGVFRDLPRTRAELLAENLLLRQQLIVASRATTRPKFALHERWLTILAARMTHRWREAVLLVQPETLLRWHREGFRLFWRKKSQATSRARLSRKTIALIQRMAMENRLWGAERIRGELLKLGIRVAKRTVQKYTQEARSRGPSGQTWSTFLRNHRHQTWACDFLNFYDVWFQPLCAFFLIDLGSREVVHVGVTREPTSTWAAQQMRNGTSGYCTSAAPLIPYRPRTRGCPAFALLRARLLTAGPRSVRERPRARVELRSAHIACREMATRCR